MNTHSPFYSYPYSSPIEYGWVCPKCQRSNAPWQPQCPCYSTAPLPYTGDPQPTVITNGGTVDSEKPSS